MEKSIGSRLILLLFFIPWLIGLGALFMMLTSYEASIADAQKGTAVIQEYRSIRMMNGKYQAKIYDNNGTFLRENVIISKDYQKPYELNEEVTIAYLDDSIEIVDHLTPLYFGILKGLIIFFALIFLAPFLPISKLKSNYIGAFFCFLFGSLILALSTFHFQQQLVFEDQSDTVVAQVIGYHVDTCENDDEEYTCYARKIAYNIGGQDYTYIEKVRRNTKKGNVGDRVDFLYLISNPSEGQLTSIKMVKMISLFGYFLGSLLLYGGYRIFTYKKE